MILNQLKVMKRQLKRRDLLQNRRLRVQVLVPLPLSPWYLFKIPRIFVISVDILPVNRLFLQHVKNCFPLVFPYGMDSSFRPDRNCRILVSRDLRSSPLPTRQKNSHSIFFQRLISDSGRYIGLPYSRRKPSEISFGKR